MDALGERADLAGIRIHAADAGGVPGEWVLAESADPGRRLLFLHGGAFSAGSALSHRTITTRLAKLTGASVLAVDYRLMPEYRRLEGLQDCQAACCWIMDNGPQGPAPADTLFLAGDSAGGNLCLAVAAWARDRGLRSADAVVAISPLTDATCSGPSFTGNLDTDHMLGPIFAHIARMPRSLYLWLAWRALRV